MKRWAALLVVAFASGQWGRGEAGDETPQLLRRVAVIGASASAGFGLAEDKAHGRADLASMLDKAILCGGVETRCFASELFFVNAKGAAEIQLEQTLAYEPTLVVAVDFLFWLVYGIMPEGSRLELFENGLRGLETFDCDLVVGTIPDMSPAIGKLLLREQVPAAETLVQANQRLLEWAKEHTKIHVAPMRELVERLQQKQPVQVREITWGVSKEDPALLQWDHLHPTSHGLAMLSLLVLDTVLANGSTFDPGLVEWDPRNVAETQSE